MYETNNLIESLGEIVSANTNSKTCMSAVFSVVPNEAFYL